MFISEGNLHKKKWSDISIRGRENHVISLKLTDIQTYSQTDTRTVICFYRVVLLLKTYCIFEYNYTYRLSSNAARLLLSKFYLKFTGNTMPSLRSRELS